MRSDVIAGRGGDELIVAHGIYGDDGYRFWFGVKSDRTAILKMPKYTAPFSWPTVDEIKRTYPNEADAADGQWCWAEIC